MFNKILLVACVSCWLLSVLSQTSGLLSVASVKPWPSSSSTSVNAAVDASFDTSWISGSCRAGGWRSMTRFNPLYGSCAAGSCSGSCNADLTSATDGSMYTAGSASLSQGEGRSWAVFPFPNDEARVVRNIFIRGAFPKDTTLFATLPDGGTVTVATLGPEMTWLEQNFAAPAGHLHPEDDRTKQASATGEVASPGQDPVRASALWRGF